MKKILFLSDINSAHTRKWVTSLASRGFEIGVFSISVPEDNWFTKLEKVTCFDVQGFSREKISTGGISKSLYITVLPRLNKIIRRFAPDIVHAHYATSYGLLGSLSGFHPFVLSVWGSDVFDFPNKSFLHRKLLSFNLRRADLVFSTSHIMALETSRYTKKKIYVTPFGVDVNVFYPGESENKLKDKIVIGTVKSLEEKYGTEYLIRGFAKAFRAREEKDLFLLIVGDGSLKDSLINLTDSLGISENVRFVGRVEQKEVPDYHRQIDIYAGVSVDDSESFGVSAVEASACGKPCIVSDAGGLKEVVVNGVTGIVVPRRNDDAVAAAILALAGDKMLREKIGKEGRERVLTEYNWEKNLDHIISLYQSGGKI